MNRRELLLAAASAASMRGATDAGIAPIKVNGKEAAAFYFAPEWDKPFLYPIRTVSGNVLSRGYPVEKIEGEQTDHVWHRGIWYGHGVVNGQDFWREQGRSKTSRLIVQGKPAVKGSKVSALTSMVPPDGKAIGSIRQEFAMADKDNLRFIDATITILADKGVALSFGDTDDGGFAFRLNDSFRQDRGAKLRNSSGLEGTEQIWGKPAHWVDYSAAVGGTRAGVTIFDHPKNLRHPTAWHARGYSLNSANPFASKSFSKGKGPDGAYTLKAGGKLEFRYRVVVHEGAFEPDAIEAEYKNWAK